MQVIKHLLYILCRNFNSRQILFCIALVLGLLILKAVLAVYIIKLQISIKRNTQDWFMGTQAFLQSWKEVSGLSNDLFDRQL